MLFPFEKCLPCSLSHLSPVLPLEAKRAKGESHFTFVFEQFSIDTFWGTFPLIVADRRTRECVSQCSCPKELATQYAVGQHAGPDVLIPNVGIGRLSVHGAKKARWLGEDFFLKLF